MKQKSFKQSSDRSLRLIVGVHLLWLFLVCLLGGWWGRLVWSQSARIAELETTLGMAAIHTQDHWHRTQRMLIWESVTYFGLLLACTAFLFWLYWRDVKRSRGLQAFFASVTHELRTPLTSIRLQAESIASALEEPRIRKNVQRLLEDTVRLEVQVERTLELARLEGGGPVYTQPVQIKPWLERFIQTWKEDFAEKIQFQLSIDDLIINADPVAIQIIFRNLLENSLRHSGKEKVDISIQASNQDNGVTISLKDNGQGFTELKNLGGLFQKGHNSPGTGVGLYLVKTLMAKMKGKVSFQSQKTGFEAILWFDEGKQNG